MLTKDVHQQPSSGSREETIDAIRVVTEEREEEKRRRGIEEFERFVEY